MNTYLRASIWKPGVSTVLFQLRQRLLKVILLISSILGTVVLGTAFIPAFRRGLYSTIAFYGIVYIWCLLITFVPRLSYRLRAIGFLVILFLLGSLNLYESGLNVDAGLIFTIFIGMTLLLMSLRGGVIALASSSLIISLFGFLNTSGKISLHMGLPQSDPLLWIIGGVIFFIIGLLLTYSLAVVVSGLEENLVKATSLAEELEKANSSLRLSEANYRTLVETSPGLVALLDLKGNIIMVNKAGLNLFGYSSQEEVVGKHFLTFIASIDHALVAEAFQRTLEVGAPKDFECLAIRRNKVSFFAEVNAALVKNEAGIPQSVITTARDITGRKEAERILKASEEALEDKVVETTAQLEKATSRLEELVRHVPTVVVSFQHPDHKISYLSENVKTILGYEASLFLENNTFLFDHVHPDDKPMISAIMNQGDDQDIQGFEFRFHKADGNYCWLRNESRILLREDGTPSEYVGTLSDITERKNSEEALRLSEARYRNLYTSIMDGFVCVDPHGRITQFNRAYQEMLGYDAAELVKLTYMDLTPEIWRPFEQEIVENQLLKQGYSDVYEKEYIRKDGSIFPVELRTVVMRNEEGQIFEMWAVVRDISARKQAERDLRESETRSRELLENSLQAVMVFQDMHIVYANQAAVLGSGFTEAELQSFTSADILRRVHAQDRHRFLEILHRHMDFTSPSGQYSLRMLHKDGTILWVEARLTGTQFQGRSAFLVTMIDVSEIKKSDETLRENTRIMRTILNASESLVFLLDPQAGLISANDKFINRMGLNPDDLAGMFIYKLIPPDLAETRRIPFEQAIKTGKPTSNVDFHGGIWFENNYYPILDDAGKVVSVAVYARDITEQKQVTEALRASEEKYRRLAEAAHDVIFIVDRHFQIQYVNTFGAEYFSVDPQQIVGQSLARLFPPEARENPQDDSLQRVLATGEAISVEEAIQFPTRKVWFNTWLVPLTNAGGEVTSVLGVARDMTEQKQVTEALRTSEEQYRTLAESSPDLIFIIDKEDRINYINSNGAIFLQHTPQEMIGQPREQFSWPGTAERQKLALQKVLTTGQAISSETETPFLDRSVWFNTRLVPLTDATGKINSVMGVSRDITEQMRVVEAQRASEQRYRMLSEASPDMIFIINQEDRIEYVNSNGAKYLRQEPGQLVGMLREDLFPVETARHQKLAIQQVLKTGQAIATETENIFLNRMIWLSTWLVPLKNAAGVTTSVMGIARDITGRKQVEEELRKTHVELEERVAHRTRELSESQEKLRLLTGQTIKAQEEERRAISRELHDEAGQALIGLKYDLSAIQAELPEAGPISRTRLDESMKIIDQTMSHIRALSHNLRPPVLEIGGLNMSLQEYCREQAKRTRIPVVYQGVDIPGLPDETGISLYRFVQETLTNAFKHASPGRVEVTLAYQKGRISLSVSDNGKGIDENSASDGLGLLGIRERLALLGGQLDVRSSKGRGTKLTAKVPWTGTN
jgi:PAS domain S-box-containing protein